MWPPVAAVAAAAQYGSADRRQAATQLATAAGAARQTTVDAATAPGKVASFDRLVKTEISPDPAERARQVDENPGLWIRLNPNVRSLILPDVLQTN